jgi:hypothetical protein
MKLTVVHEDSPEDLVIDNVGYSGAAYGLLFVLTKGADWDDAREVKDNSPAKVYNIKLDSILRWEVEYDEADQKSGVKENSEVWQRMKESKDE